MARGEVAKDCKVGEGSTSSGRNSGSSAKRSSKSTSDRTLLESRQGHLLCPRLQLPPLPATRTLHRVPQPMLTCPQSQRSSSGAGAAPSPSCRHQPPPCARGRRRPPSHCHPHCCRCCCQELGLEPGPGWEGWEAPPGSPSPARGHASLKTSWGIWWPGGWGGEGDGEHWGQTHQGKTQKQRGITEMDADRRDTELWAGPSHADILAQGQRRTHKGMVQMGRGKSSGTEGQTGDRGAEPSSGGHPQAAGHSPWSQGPWCWPAPRQVGAAGDCSGLWESRSHGAVEGLVLLAAPQALTRTLGAHGLGQAPRAAGVQGLAAQEHQPRRSPQECWRWPPLLSGGP